MRSNPSISFHKILQLSGAIVLLALAPGRGVAADPELQVILDSTPSPITGVFTVGDEVDFEAAALPQVPGWVDIGDSIGGDVCKHLPLPILPAANGVFCRGILLAVSGIHRPEATFWRPDNLPMLPTSFAHGQEFYVLPHPSTIKLESLSNPGTAGNSITLRATVGSGVMLIWPTRLARFMDGATLLCESPLELTPGQAIDTPNPLAQADCATTKLSVGAHAITATYAGDAALAPSFSPAIVQMVTATPTNGVCGTDNGQILLAAPAANLCSAGTATAVTGNGHPWSWSCNGANGGANASCSATIRTWTVTATVAGGSGAATPLAQAIDNGASATVTLLPAAGYTIDRVYGCDAGTYVGPSSGPAHATFTVVADCTFNAVFIHTITYPPPTAAAVTANVPLNTTAHISLSGEDPNSVSTLVFAIATAPAHGKVVLDATHLSTSMLAAHGNATATYTPANNYFGADSFAYTVASDNGVSAPALVSINIAAQPVATTTSAPALSWPALLALAGAMAMLALRKHIPSTRASSSRNAQQAPP